MAFQALRNFLKLEAAAGVLLMLSTALALLLCNSPAAETYAKVLEVRLALTIGGQGFDKPLLLWINDGLMAWFFLLVGLELKREMLAGQLTNRAQIMLPAIGAAGGFIVPALIYAWFNQADPMALKGWAVASATDIAFSLGVLSLLGGRVPLSLKLFLTSLAIFDDLAAILAIAVFYTTALSGLALAGAAICIAVLSVMNRRGVTAIAAYLVVGFVLWAFVLKSGVHATLAGIVVAMALPLRGTHDGESPLRRLEHGLHPWVAYAVLPIFALANAGVPLLGIEASSLLGNVPLGITAGLFLGKQLGVFASCWVSIRLGLARLPSGASWASFYGVCVLTGIGFTMSLFIGNLAFEQGGFDYLAGTRLGVLLGSGLSAVAGYFILRAVTRPIR